MYLAKHLIYICFIICTANLRAETYFSQDTIPPVFTSNPENLSLACTAPLSEELNMWINNGGNAVADNGEAEVRSLTSAVDALNELLQQFGLNCSTTGSLNVGFIAIDSCNNVSADTLFATFEVHDRISPEIVDPATDRTNTCAIGIRDTLNLWLNTQGGATAEDNCGSVIWSHYTWQDNLGNEGFTNFGDTTDIVILRDSCAFSVDVSFFVADDCDNLNVTSASFIIESDTVSPIFTSFPSDTLIMCDASLDSLEVIAFDDCDGVLELVQSIVTSQSSDSLTCGYYNYRVQNIWSATDACGNAVRDTQFVEVRDTLVPTTTFDQLVVVDCGEDLSDPNLFLDISDNCSDVGVTFRDSLAIDNTCQQQIERVWSISDICENTLVINQTIQIQDFNAPIFSTPPQDLVIQCGISDNEALFNDWIENNAGAVSSDNCADSRILIREIADYQDTLALVSGDTVSFMQNTCDPSLGNNIISEQSIGIYSYDDCGNITMEEIKFQVIDTISPLLNCPENRIVELDSGDCFFGLTARMPDILEECSTDNLSWELVVDQDTRLENLRDSTILTLESGFHTLEYAVFDCVNNERTCIQTIDIIDRQPPEIECPSQLSLYVDQDNCTYSFDIPTLTSYNDNCFGSSDFSITQPRGDGLLNFQFNTLQDTFKATNFPVEFDNVSIEGRLFRPSLQVDYHLNISDGSSVKVLSEFGDIIIELTEGNCTQEKIVELLDPNQFNVWSNDGDIKFTILFEDNNGTGTHPCDNDALTTHGVQDGISFISLTLEYSDIIPEVRIEDSNLQELDIEDDEIELEIGDYQLTYSATDRQDNLSTCITTIMVRDTISTAMTCIDTTIVIPLGSDIEFLIDQASVLSDVTDNCGVSDISIRPNTINCSQTEETLNIEVIDINDNISRCNVDIQIQSDTLSPFFVSGLCLADTLKLFSGADASFTQSISWTGPDGFNSPLSDPILTSINEDNSGTYTLEIIGLNGCVYTSTLDIDVSQFDSPEISATDSFVCEGDLLVLNSTSFNEIVEYFWHEGISPNGTLIDQTSGPSLSITPIEGIHFYYVEVRGQNCNSTPSNTLQVEVLPIPIAEIENPFITICEGESINLESATFNQNYEYEWRGPDGYFSEGQNAEIVTDASAENEGTYTLIVRNRNCVSDTTRAQVVIFEAPPTPEIIGESILCEGQSAVLSVDNVTSGTRYQWFLNGNLFNTTSTNSLVIPSITSSQSGSWTVIVEDGICNSEESEDFDIFIESSLTIGASNNGPVCEGDSVSLTSSFIPNASYRWSDPSGNLFEGREIMVEALEGIYSVTITTGSNCNSTTETFVEVNVKPQITALSNTTLPCMDGNTPVSLVPSVFPPGNYSYSWTGPNNFMSSEESPTLINANESDNGVYELIISEGICDSDPAITTVDITLNPEMAELQANLLPCENEDLQVSITNPISGNGIQWIWTTPLGQIITTEPFLEVENFDADDEGLYSVIQERNGCRSESSLPLNIELQRNPITPVIQGSNEICVGGNLILETNLISGATYTWATPGGNIETIANTLEIENVSQSDAGIYSVVIRNGDCTSDISNALSITVFDAPVPAQFSESEISVCAAQSNELIVCIEELNQDFDNIQILDASTGTIFQEGSGPCFDLSFLLNNSSATYELTAVYVDGNCTSQPSQTIRVDVFDQPNTSAQVNDDKLFLCDQDFLNITPDNIPDNIDIDWTSNDPEINIFRGQAGQYSFSNLREGQNTLILESSVPSCGVYAVDTLEVFVVTEINANDDFASGNFDQDIIIEVLRNDNLQQNSEIVSTTEPNSGSATLKGNQITYTPEQNYVGTIEFDYQVCYTDCPDFCDISTVTIEIGNNIECFAGNVITPNNDGYNDAFIIPCLNSGSYNSNQVTIYNQWGDEIFSAAPYENDWDGTYNGQTVPVGTYYYILDLGDGSKPLQGFITVEL